MLLIMVEVTKIITKNSESQNLHIYNFNIDVAHLSFFDVVVVLLLFFFRNFYYE